MKLYAPSYYKNFKCIADKCEHSCCIGWEIDVDDATFEKYRLLKNDYATAIMDSISVEDTPHFRLCHGDRCPHLDENGLCKIILNAGEDYLCDICREHPRFYNYTDALEVGIGMSCREAARVILNCPDYAKMEHIGDTDAVADGISFDGRALRAEIYGILQDPARDYNSRLEEIYRKFCVDKLSDGVWHEKLFSLEYLDVSHRDLFMNYCAKRRPDFGYEYLERFLAYLIYRHCTEAVDIADFKDRLGFCLFAERLLASLICAAGASTLNDVAVWASIISEEIEYSDDNTWSLIY